MELLVPEIGSGSGSGSLILPCCEESPPHPQALSEADRRHSWHPPGHEKQAPMPHGNDLADATGPSVRRVPAVRSAWPTVPMEPAR